MSAHAGVTSSAPIDPREDSLSDALAREMRSAPWYASSLALHSVVLLALMLLPPQYERKSTAIRSPMIVDIPPVEETDPVEPIIDKFERDPEHTVDTAELSDIQPINIEIIYEKSDTFQTDNNQDTNEALGDINSLTTVDNQSDDSPTLIGVGASGPANSGGRPFGTSRIGGHDSFVRDGIPHPRPAITSEVAALRWLAAHQESDGHWDCAKYGGAAHDVAMTSLALLAFLGDGSSCDYGRFKDNVRRATDWLLKQQDGAGRIGPYRYEAAISTMAISESYGMSVSDKCKKGDLRLREAAQKCVDDAVKGQCQAGGFDYTPASLRNDTSVFGWWTMALKSAKISGLHVPYETLERAKKYIQQATTDPAGDNGYGGTCRVSYCTDKANALEQIRRGGGSTRMTAVSLTCLQFLGQQREDPQVMGTANQVIADGMPSQAKSDFYRWYYASLGLFQLGVRNDKWRAFAEPLYDTLCQTQVKVGSFKENKGSWDFDTEQHGAQWGRVGQTALGALMLEVFWRYKNPHNSGAVEKKGL